MVSMLSKRCLSTAVLALISLTTVDCSVSRETGDEKNFSFSIDRNLIVLTQATINGRPARIILGTAVPVSLRHSGLVKNPGPLRKNPIEVGIGSRYHVSIHPDPVDLAGIGELLLGYDAFPERTVVIDFNRRLISLLKNQRAETVTSDLQFSPFQDFPAIQIEVDGARLTALIDTANADTVTLPARLNNGRKGRRKVDLTVGGNDMGRVDASFASVSSARIGNRILQHFLIRIDYQNKRISLLQTSRGNR